MVEPKNECEHECSHCGHRSLISVVESDRLQGLAMAAGRSAFYAVVEEIIDEGISGLRVGAARRYSTTHLRFVINQFEQLKRKIREAK